MNNDREEALFALALSKPAAKRAAWLDAECEGDATLRAGPKGGLKRPGHALILLA
jgi:hypothetical protein